MRWVEPAPSPLDNEPMPFDAGALFLAACVFLLAIEVIVGAGFVLHLVVGR